MTIYDNMTSSVTLNHFDPRQETETKIQVDASNKALGAALIQIDPNKPTMGHIISFASKSITETETCYVNIERELLAVVFVADRFHLWVKTNHCRI